MADGETEKRRAVWVMTLSRDYKTATFWDCCSHKEDVLEHRILDNEVTNLRTYLNP
jgi:hypothetical protein